MSSQTIDVLFDVPSQSLHFDAPEGRPSAVTASSIYESAAGDDSTVEDATSGSPSIEATPNTTIDADSGPGQSDERRANVASTSGAAVGRVYLLTNAAGEKDWAEVAAISSGAYVVARDPLQNAYASGDTLQTTRISQPLSTSWCAEVGNISGSFDPNPRYRWRLRYTVSSVEYVHDLYFDLVRYAARHDVTPIDVDRRAPGWMQRVATFHREDQGRSLIDEAWVEVKFDLYSMSTPDQSIRNREVVNELVKLKAIALVDRTDVSAKAYGDRLSQLIAWGKAATDKDGSGAGSAADIRPLWRR